MDALFISYTRLLENTSKNKDDFYRDSLKDQFTALQLRIPIEKRTDDFVEFFEAMSPSGLQKKYTISCPNFLRELQTDGKTVFLKNVVLKPELTLSMKRYLPDGQNIILIGDIAERDDRSEFNVKGMQNQVTSMELQAVEGIRQFPYTGFHQRTDRQVLYRKQPSPSSPNLQRMAALHGL